MTVCQFVCIALYAGSSEFNVHGSVVKRTCKQYIPRNDMLCSGLRGLHRHVQLQESYGSRCVHDLQVCATCDCALVAYYNMYTHYSLVQTCKIAEI